MPQEENIANCRYCGPICKIPFGLCHCGCGSKTKIATISSKKYNQERGQPQKYLYGHARRGPALPAADLCICRDPRCLVPWGECHCGCGQRTLLCLVTDTSRNAIKGKPQKFIVGHTLRTNRLKSVDAQIASRTKHGMQKRGVINSTYYSWAGMKQRCLNPNNRAYGYYGGRGIKICDRWLKFERLNDLN